MTQTQQHFQKLHNRLGFPVLTFEFEIILALHEHSMLTAHSLIRATSASPSSFTYIIRNLISREIVQKEKDVTDARRVIYRLTPAANMFLEEWKHNISTHL